MGHRRTSPGRIGVEESAWLRRMLHSSGTIDDEGRKFMHELKGAAKEVSHEFEALFSKCMNEPLEQRTCGG